MQIFALNLELQAYNYSVWRGCYLFFFVFLARGNNVITRTLGSHLNMLENKLLVSSKLLNSGI